ncbi:hypothetical protein GCM10022229_19150 [Luteimonas lutimaris]|uniref:Protein kinase domain-containing protein n=2 Tax=Luteimonas lutimaris TaxID=698645 RepID=A0ABP7MLA6_9GAMM
MWPQVARTMKTGHWLRAKEILGELDGVAREQHASRIAAACAGDVDLQAEVERLLALDDAAGAWFSGLQDALGQLDRATPDQVGPYRIVREIGRGGMGSVFLGERCDGQFEQRVAIKVVHDGIGGRLIARFRDERRILAQLEHPGIAYLLDGGSLPDGRPYFVMEYVKGESITTYCDRKRLDIKARLDLFRDICAAVAYAHRNLVIHRDLKPGNVMVEEDDQGQPSIKLLDFGIARIVEAGADDGDPEAGNQRARGTGDRVSAAAIPLLEHGQTQHDERLLTPLYAAPEQLRGEPVTTAADIYALGVLLHELLTGARPFADAAATREQMERAILEDEPTPPSRIARASDDSIANLRGTDPAQLSRLLRGDLDSIVRKTLHKQPERRYASAGQLSDDIEHHLRGVAVTARGATRTYRAGLFLRRHRWGMAAIAVALIASLSAAMFHVSGITRERDLANAEAAKAEEVASLLIGMFESADPSQARGEDITVREVLDRAAANLDDGLSNQPAVLAEMKHIMGGIYAHLGEYDTAADLLQRGLALRRQLHGPRHPDVAESQHSLAVLEWMRGRYDPAEALLRDVLAQYLEQPEQDPLKLAKVRNNLAAVLRRKGGFDEAESLYRQVIATRRAQLGDDHPDLLSSQHNLALLLNVLGRADEAEVLFRDVLASRRRTLGPIHPQIANTTDSLAFLLRDEERFVEAESLLRETLAMRLALYDDNHPLVADTMNALGGVLRMQQRYDEAETFYRKALAIRREAFGDGNQHVASSLNNLANLHRDRDNYTAAEPLYREAIGIYRDEVGAEHAWTATSIKSLGELYMKMGDAKAAEAQFREALRIREKVHSPGHWQIAEVRSLLGATLAEQGRLDAAEPLLVRAHAVFEQSRGARDSKTQEALARLTALRERRSATP